MCPPHLLTRLLASLAFALSWSATAQSQSRVIYVDHTATGANTGASWTDAFTDPHPALAAADHGDQIWIAQGTYRTTPGAGRNISFVVSRSIAVLGGFVGNETKVSQRDPRLHPVILSGDLGVPGASADDAFHVVRVDNAHGTEPVVLDGLVIRRGHADQFARDQGGGIRLRLGGLVLRSCVVEENGSNDVGGGIWAYDGTALAIQECVFSRNWARHGAALHASIQYSIVDTRFVGNTSTVPDGTAIRSYAGGSFIRCAFQDNSASVRVVSPFARSRRQIFQGCDFENTILFVEEGRIEVENGRFYASPIHSDARDSGTRLILEIRKSRFSGASQAAAVEIIGEDHPSRADVLELDRCQFYDNSIGVVTTQVWTVAITNSVFAGNDEAVRIDRCGNQSLFGNDTVVANRRGLTVDGPCRVFNSIFFGNAPLGGDLERGQIVLSATRAEYSCIEGLSATAGIHNTALPPTFVDPARRDYRLRAGSVLIDRGHPNSAHLLGIRIRDLEGDPRPVGMRVDVGADELR